MSSILINGSSSGIADSYPRVGDREVKEGKVQWKGRLRAFFALDAETILVAPAEKVKTESNH